MIPPPNAGSPYRFFVASDVAARSIGNIGSGTIVRPGPRRRSFGAPAICVGDGRQSGPAQVRPGQVAGGAAVRRRRSHQPPPTSPPTTTTAPTTPHGESPPESPPPEPLPPEPADARWSEPPRSRPSVVLE